MSAAELTAIAAIITSMGGLVSAIALLIREVRSRATKETNNS